ncbi:tRNA (N6-threonylcarbamoyladenosine(37)-N6)-methyltransferase TrmO [Photobacterium sanctipauli]|uniref:tRNA (N6-threonylcarbamoyladenosine(37)-N6)-methyltransferase TrmO n=1 Tax=Photobacterium sanctipauli TaxID=1342794 RepID=A0A2T3NYN2_9GAMM|nr:tRNA (N6-threonylcarbamoyladenosine(37)-N6)-methyltransferase TrmO [Photobacterium sanctipauli]PSW21387.1 tRNA (N6-threonylcarbamoyladenosine(37)-N6)-methyltransferase TrmO [Photobacterium sanctipauli]
MTTELNFIGAISTPYTEIHQCPNNIQFDGPLCEVTLYDEFKEGLTGLEDGQQVLILYWLYDANRAAVKQPTCRAGVEKGTFALRSPHRPNPIGAAVLTIEKREEGRLTVRGLDCLNGTKVIDIKPAIYRELL